MDLQLKDKVVLVTGGSKGIGQAIARSFLVEGGRVVNVNRSSDEGLRMEAEYARQEQVCRFVQGDLCDPATAERAVRQTLDEFGRLDVLVNNAGVNDGVGLSAGPEAFSESLRRNLLHVYALAHHALPALKHSQGAIVNIGSKVAETGQGGTSGYAAAKGAMNALTREWAVDLAPHGIRVNAVIPAETWTPLYEKCLESMPDPAAARASIERLIPLGRRFTTSDEIARTVVFLASPASSHTTGQIVYVDGGYTHLDRKCTTAGVEGRLATGESEQKSDAGPRAADRG